MPTQANPYLVITDGTTTVTIADGSGGNTSYILEPGNWTPAVAGLRRGQLGGAGPYEDVVEEMILHIKGADAATAYANLDTLNRLLDAAARWYRGEFNDYSTGASDPPNAVKIKYAPKGSTTASTATPYIAHILGPVESESGASLSAKWNQAGDSFIIDGVRVRFMRRGLWVCGSDTASSSATDNGTVAAIGMSATLNTFSPTNITVTNLILGNNSTNQTYGHGGYLVITSGALNYHYALSESSAVVAPFSSVAETGAKSGSVTRYTPTGTTEALFTANTSLQVLDGNLWGVFVVARNNSATTDFFLRALTYEGSVVTGNPTPKVVIEHMAAPYPTVIYVGALSYTRASTIGFGVTASAASGTLDIDQILFVNLRWPETHIIGIPPLSDYATGINTVVINQNIDSPSRPHASMYVSSAFARIEHTGSINIYTRDDNLRCLWLATGGYNLASSPGNWFLQRNVSGASTLSNTWTAVRYPGYLAAV